MFRVPFVNTKVKQNNTQIEKQKWFFVELKMHNASKHETYYQELLLLYIFINSSDNNNKMFHEKLVTIFVDIGSFIHERTCI